MKPTPKIVITIFGSVYDIRAWGTLSKVNIERDEAGTKNVNYFS